MEESSIKVYDWMVHKLRLKGNELLCYALIYNECKEFGVCLMTQKELCQQTGISIATIGKLLKNLCQKGFLKKEQYTYENFPYYSYSLIEKQDGTL